MNTIIEKELAKFKSKNQGLIKKIENICGGYSIDNYSIGRLLTVVGYVSQKKNTDKNIDDDLIFSNDELLKIGQIMNFKKKQDLSFAYDNLKKIIKGKYNIELPKKLSQKNKYLNVFENEFNFLSFLMDRFKDNRNIKDIKNDNLKLNRIKKYTQDNNTNYYVFDAKKQGIKGLDLMILRDKTTKSILSKEIERFSRLYFPFDEDKANMISNNIDIEFIDNNIFNKYCIGLLERVFYSGCDFQEFYNNHMKYSYDPQFNISINAIEKLFLTDVAGFKITGNRNEIIGDDKNFEEILNSEDKDLSLNQYLVKYSNKLKELRSENNHRKIKKDLSIVKSYRGGNNIGNYHELRLSIDDIIIQSDITGSEILGITPHYLYKPVLFQDLKNKLRDSEDFYKVAINMCKTKDLTLDDVLN
jgi:hypothetical protein